LSLSNQEKQSICYILAVSCLMIAQEIQAFVLEMIVVTTAADIALGTIRDLIAVTILAVGTTANAVETMRAVVTLTKVHRVDRNEVFEI